MTDALLLRFRDLTAGVNTIDAHNEIALASDYVYWGWWKKPPELMPDPALSLLAKEVESGAGIAYMINSADGRL